MRNDDAFLLRVLFKRMSIQLTTLQEVIANMPYAMPEVASPEHSICLICRRDEMRSIDYIYWTLTAESNVFDLRPRRQQLKCVFYRIAFHYIATLLCLEPGLIGGRLEQDGTIADLREHIDESKRLRGGAADEIVQFVAGEDLLENS